jgi:hypothetical protein
MARLPLPGPGRPDPVARGCRMARRGATAGKMPRMGDAPSPNGFRCPI